MRNLSATVCLTIAVLLGSVGISESADSQKVIPFDKYHENGKLALKGTWKDGKYHGPWVGYYDNGQLRYKGTYKDDKRVGPWVGYYDNGQLRYKGTYKNGLMDGPWVDYYENGTVNKKNTGTYKNSVKVN
jgi:antitoxin component YwqK of YwqJK toxin-antitoxin module